MKIYNENKTIELTEYDLMKGYLKNDTLTVHHDKVEQVEEVSHYETVKEYYTGKEFEVPVPVLDDNGEQKLDENGEPLYTIEIQKEVYGKEVKKVIDTPFVKGVDAYDEEIEIKVYIPYTEVELKKIEDSKTILELKQKLASTDYKAIKYAEGELVDEEYAETKAQRKQWREEINRLQGE